MAEPVVARHIPVPYRGDIDGLRAIAVSAVVLFHAGLGLIPGGFVGVDVFFVISGYLIGGQIYRDTGRRAFSFTGFYARRAKRILPALFVLLIVFYAVGLAIMTPHELRQLGRESVGTVLGLANILFYQGGGYFAPTADYSPLLVTWSLGVEEQFYLLFPILMIAIMRFRRQATLGVVIILSVISFIGSLALTRIDSQAAFYLLPTRAWELGIGAVLAIYEQGQRETVKSRWPVEVAALIGLGLVIAALMTYRPEITFPGWFAIIPTIGTVLLVATPGSTVNRVLLAAPPMRFLGKISYSWYLWHWPIFFFNRVLNEGGPGVSPLILIPLSLALAVLSWRFVEQPFRTQQPSRRAILIGYGSVAAVLIGIALLFYAKNGLPQRLPATQRAAAVDAARSSSDACLGTFSVDAPANLSRCVPPLTSGQHARVMMLGDSHASAISSGIGELAKRNGYGFGEMTKSSCLPLPGYAQAMVRIGERDKCLMFQRRAFAYVESHPEITTVVLAGYWSGGVPLHAEDLSGPVVPLETALNQTVRRLEQSGRTVVLIQDVPILRFDPYARFIGAGMSMRRWLTSNLGSASSSRHSVPRAEVVADLARPVLARVAQRANLRLIDPVEALCQESQCRFSADGNLLYFDFQHLTLSGSREAVRGASLSPVKTGQPQR